jgi:hypothetical protein
MEVQRDRAAHLPASRCEGGQTPGNHFGVAVVPDACPRRGGCALCPSPVREQQNWPLERTTFQRLGRDGALRTRSATDRQNRRASPHPLRSQIKGPATRSNDSRLLPFSAIYARMLAAANSNDQERWLIEVSCFDCHRPRAQADAVVAAEGRAAAPAWSGAASLRRGGASCHQGWSWPGWSDAAVSHWSDAAMGHWPDAAVSHWPDGAVGHWPDAVRSHFPAHVGASRLFGVAARHH